MGGKGRAFVTEKRFCAKTEQQMLQLGACVAKALQGGSFVALFGNMGAGKTVFTRGMGLALGTEEVASPTFTIVQEHDTQPPLFHFDAYRVGEEELYDIGFDEYLTRNGIIVMEWPQNAGSLLPEERLEVEISGSGEQERIVVIRALGEAYEGLLVKLDGRGES